MSLFDEDFTDGFEFDDEDSATVDDEETVEIADETEIVETVESISSGSINPTRLEDFTRRFKVQDKAEEELPSPEEPEISGFETTQFADEKACEEQKEKLSMIIEGVSVTMKDIANEAASPFSNESKKVRKYTNVATFKKPVFSKPKEIGGLSLKKIIIFLLVCLAIGVFLAVEANSYYFFKQGKTDELSCCFAWLTVDNLPIYLNELNMNVVGLAMGIGSGITAIIGLFIYLDKEQRQHSRVGHEHGNARLGTPSDFKNFKLKFMENNDNNMLFGVYQGKELGLSLNNKLVNRSANVLVIGGTGTGKTFKYIKPNILQENCSMIVTDPSGDIFRSFAPYLLSKGYNVYLFNASDFTLSNHYNPLLNVYNSNGEIDETQVDILVDLYMKNAKAGKAEGGSDPFWDKSEKSFLTALIYYVLENDAYKDKRCFSQILELVQKAKVDDDSDEESPLTQEMNLWFEKMRQEGRKIKAKSYYDTFLIAPQKTANTILITTAVDLQIFSTKEVDFITQESPIKEMNIDINKIATQQSYLFLGIPQSHQAYNFIIAMLYSQLYGRMYELGERKLRGKYHIGYTVGTPVFDYFDSKEQAQEFYETITTDDIIESDYINGTKIYNIIFRGKSYKTSVLKEPLEKFINELDKMYIWGGDEFAGGDPALPIHINFLLDEFKNSVTRSVLKRCGA